jgi:hypothetical protein
MERLRTTFAWITVPAVPYDAIADAVNMFSEE